MQKHIELTDAIISSGVDKVFTVGELTLSLFNKLPIALRGCHFLDAVSASKNARGFIESGDVVLVKGSNAMDMWRVVRALREISKIKLVESHSHGSGQAYRSGDRNVGDS